MRFTAVHEGAWRLISVASRLVRAAMRYKSLIGTNYALKT